MDCQRGIINPSKTPQIRGIRRGSPLSYHGHALQAGGGVATVDHVLNGRAHAREHARKRVEQAIKEIEKQELQLFI
ncbi:MULTISPECIES: LacI family DNA-binding transcriptional regulator [Paraburkholderia]|jgi:hypothetical protein|uniref:LacI family DNA-binding transcriptional regulator n=1 Tax=Paraburkholderia dipogonis TaxID=1211383 RepID=A0ABW9B261_9BURK